MTEGPVEIALAAQAQAAGKAAAAQGGRWAQQTQNNISGSQTAFDPPPERPDAIAVGWTGTSVEPPAIAPPPTSASNVDNPLDNSQSQP